MVLGFKKQFEPLVLEGSKIHTLREDRHNRWRAGTAIQMATGVRTAYYSCFNKAVCTGVQKIFLSCENGILSASLNGDEFMYDMDMLAHNDGFENAAAMAKFFFPSGNGEWWGKIIHWTDFKY